VCEYQVWSRSRIVLLLDSGCTKMMRLLAAPAPQHVFQGVNDDRLINFNQFLALVTTHTNLDLDE
jgi:hypothetical protein